MDTIKASLFVVYHKNNGIGFVGGIHPNPDVMNYIALKNLELTKLPDIVGYSRVDVDVPAWPQNQPLSTLPPETQAAELATASATHVDGAAG